MGIFLGIIVAVIGYGIFVYNRLITLRNNRENAFADIDVQLTNRFDLVGNLVETVKGYAKHEKELLTSVTQQRTAFLNANGIDDKLQANNALTGSLKSLFAVSENYPDLKANETFVNLQSELSDLENKLAATRRYFNSATKEYNTAIQVFPANIIAGQFGFKQEPFFELEDQEAKKTPKVSF